ncbi:MAG TPA: alanine racemase, partial [Magnetospirillaceae bacterium]|nr:alanine racemase [Magnetospirillaceae bacterium]
MREFDSVGARLSNARERIGRAARRAGRDPAEVEILAVTKFHPVQAAEAAYGAGIRIFGENRVQEALEKYPAFLEGRPGAEVHMLGHLQGNKVRKAAGLFRCVQSVDSMELMRDLDRRAATLGL